MGLPDESVGRDLLGGNGCPLFCWPDLVCLVLYAGPSRVGGEGVLSSFITWTLSLHETDFFFGGTVCSSLLTPYRSYAGLIVVVM